MTVTLTSATMLQSGQDIALRWNLRGPSAFPRVAGGTVLSDSVGGTWSKARQRAFAEFGTCQDASTTKVSNVGSNLIGHFYVVLEYRDSGGATTDISPVAGYFSSNAEEWAYPIDSGTYALRVGLPRDLDSGGSLVVWMMQTTGAYTQTPLAASFYPVATPTINASSSTYPYGYVDIIDETPTGLTGGLPNWWSWWLVATRTTAIALGDTITLSANAGLVYDVTFDGSYNESTSQQSPSLSVSVTLPTDASLGTVQVYEFDPATPRSGRFPATTADVLIYRSSVPGTKVTWDMTGVTDGLMFNNVGSGVTKRIRIEDFHFTATSLCKLNSLKRTAVVHVKNCTLENVGFVATGYWDGSYLADEFTLENCVIRDCRESGPGKHVSGIFVELTRSFNTLKCVLDYNGITDPVLEQHTIYSHQCYVQRSVRNVFIRDSWYIRGGGNAIQARAGGVIFGCVAIDQPMAFDIQGGGNIAGCAVYGACDLKMRDSSDVPTPDGRGWGLSSMGSSWVGTQTVADSIIVNANTIYNDFGTQMTNYSGTGINKAELVPYEVHEGNYVKGVRVGTQVGRCGNVAVVKGSTLSASVSPIYNLFASTYGDIGNTKTVSAALALGSPDLYAVSLGFANWEAMRQAMRGGTAYQTVGFINYLRQANGLGNLDDLIGDDPDPPPPDPDPEPGPGYNPTLQIPARVNATSRVG
jgi:hypothetical protein